MSRTLDLIILEACKWVMIIVVIQVRILFDGSCNFVRFSIEHSSSNLKSSDTKLKSQLLTGNDTNAGADVTIQIVIW